jgi:hemerythrin-like domain-containing protein
MTIVHVLLGEHGAMYPLFAQIESSAHTADLAGIQQQARFLEATLVSHADLEDALLRPEIRQFLPPAEGPTDHELIRAALNSVAAAEDATTAQEILLATVAKTRKHFTKEETIIFPIARREISLERQQQLAEEWATRRGVAVH